MKARDLFCLFSLCLIVFTLSSCGGKTERTESIQIESEIAPQKEIVLPDWIEGKTWRINDDKGALITAEIFRNENRIRFWMYGFSQIEDCLFYINEIANDVCELKFYFNNVEMKVYVNTQNNTFYTSTGTNFIDGNNHHSINDWIIGDWVPDEEFYAEGEIITFEQNGTFSFGDDCGTEGTYNIKDNAVYLKGKTRCYDSDPDFEEDYNATIAIQGNNLKGYKKTISNEAITSLPIPSLSNSSEQINYLLQNTFRCEVKDILYVYHFVSSSYDKHIKLDMIAYLRTGASSKAMYEFAYDDSKNIFRKVAGAGPNVNIEVESNGQVIVIFSDGKMAYLTKD